MKKPPVLHCQHLHALPDSLWRAKGALHRSREITPLYVDRYAGPRPSRENAPLGAHAFWELVFVFDGEGVHFGKPDRPLCRDSAVLIPPGVKHNESSDGRFDTLWLALGGERLDALPRKDVFHVRSAPSLRPWMERLWLANERRHALAGPELDGLVLAAFGEFFHCVESEIAAPSNILDAALRFIQERLSEPLAVTTIADHAGCSGSFLHREFKRRLGRTPAAYLADARLEHALKLMRNIRISANEAAVRAGFGDPRQFRRVCKRRYGRTPSGALAERLVRGGSV